MRQLKSHYETHFLIYELAGITLLAALAVAAVEFSWGRQQFLQLLSGYRQSLYIVLATVAGTLLGFIVTTVSVIIGFSQSPRLKLITESRHYGDIYRIFFSTIKFLGIFTLWSIIALLLDSDNSPKVWITYISFWLLLIVMIRLYRSIWIMERIIMQAVDSKKGSPSRAKSEQS